jgi:hypothetical protein
LFVAVFPTIVYLFDSCYVTFENVILYLCLLLYFNAISSQTRGEERERGGGRTAVGGGGGGREEASMCACLCVSVWVAV